MLAVTVQRDRTADRMERPEALLAALDPQFLVEQPPPDHHCLARDLRVDLIGDTRHGEPAVDADGAPLGLAREGAETLPGAHGADATLG